MLNAVVEFLQALSCSAEKCMFRAIFVTSFETIYTKQIPFER